MMSTNACKTLRERFEKFKKYNEYDGETEYQLVGLIEAAMADDLMNMMACIEAGYDINFSIPSSPIHGTALHCAVNNGSLPAVKLLLAHGADMNQVHDNDFDNVTPVCLAAAKNHVDILRYFIDKGANVNDISSDTAGPAIVFAAVHGSIESIVVLIQAGADINLSDCDGQTPIFFAAYHGHRDIVATLKEAGACCEMEELGAALYAEYN